MSKKKQKGNGFYIFMREMQQELRQRGKIVSIRDMPTLAGPKWAQLPDAKKHAYQAVAKGTNQGPGFTANSDLNPPVLQGPPRLGKMDSTGMLLSVSKAVHYGIIPIQLVDVLHQECTPDYTK